MTEDHLSLHEQKPAQPEPPATLKASLEQQLIEVARKAVAEYVTLLVQSKKQELKEQLDKDTEILSMLQEIHAEVTKNNANLGLEREVLEQLRRELTP